MILLQTVLTNVQIDMLARGEHFTLTRSQLTSAALNGAELMIQYGSRAHIERRNRGINIAHALPLGIAYETDEGMDLLTLLTSARDGEEYRQVLESQYGLQMNRLWNIGSDSIAKHCPPNTSVNVISQVLVALGQQDKAREVRALWA